MSEADASAGKMRLPDGHPSRGSLRAGEVEVGEGGSLKDLSRAMNPSAEGQMAFDITAGKGRLSFNLDGRLAAAFRAGGEIPKELIREALERIPDRDPVTGSLSGRIFHGLLLDRSPHPFEDHHRNDFFGVNTAAFQVKDPLLRRIFLQVGIIHQLRHEALPSEARDGREWEMGLMKKDAGLFLLLLTDHKRRVFFLPRILEEVDALVTPASGFREVLAPILSRLPFVKRDDPAASPFGLPFLNANAFDRLRTREKVRMILGGLLAWYSVLTLGLLFPFFSLFRRASPYFDPARQMLRHSFREGFLLKRGFMSRAFRALFRGNLPEAVEFFWSGWNPVLVRVAVRPVYRFLGGNRRPILATTGTFLYTAWIVHLLWLAGTILLAFRLASISDPHFTTGARIGANAHFAVLLGAVGAYTLFGFLSGLSKALRARRRQRG
ncbi:MAG: hypothetical protein ACYTHM_13400 [Planctomycetota bacterium]|jgi:hypothetical protein